MTPVGGRELLAMRLQGKRPAKTVWVTDSPTYARRGRQWGFHMLVVEAGNGYDMTCVYGLDVSLITDSQREKLAPVCQSILEAEPRSFMVSWKDETEWVIRAATH